MNRVLALALFGAGCAHQAPASVEAKIAAPPQVAPAIDEAPRAALQAFVTAAERHDFREAYALLAGPLRDRYTPERLALDFEAEPLAKERLARIRAALKQPISVSANRATLALGAASAVKLQREAEAWRVGAIE